MTHQDNMKFQFRVTYLALFLFGLLKSLNPLANSLMEAFRTRFHQDNAGNMLPATWLTFIKYVEFDFQPGDLLAAARQHRCCFWHATSYVSCWMPQSIFQQINKQISKFSTRWVIRPSLLLQYTNSWTSFLLPHALQLNFWTSPPSLSSLVWSFVIYVDIIPHILQ